MEIDQELKQRLVGAVVVTSLTAIFVPMLFDDPIDKTGKIIRELKIPKAPVKPEATEFNSLPYSRNDVLERPESQVFKDVKAGQSTVTKDFKKWFIQVGIFSQKENAVELQAKLRRAGYSVTMSKESSSKGLMYRVRVGPEINKEKAENRKLELKTSYKINGILTSVDE